ncbi:MAG: SOS response-associated peptidase family protein [Candidatus Paceibacterota bacterium]
MCGRYVLYEELEEINHFLNSIESEKFSSDGNGGYRKNYNVAPTSVMPVILHPSEFDDWLNPGNEDPDFLKDFLKPYPDDGIEEHIVSQAVGNVRNNGSGLIEKADLFG